MKRLIDRSLVARRPHDLDPERPDLVACLRKGKREDWVARQEAARGRYDAIWCSRAPVARRMRPGATFYVVADGELKCKCRIVAVRKGRGGWLCFIRTTGPLGRVTLDAPVRSFRGMRYRFWPLEAELPGGDA